MKSQNLTTESGFLCRKTQSISLKLSFELIGVLLWFNKISPILLRIVQ